jgi:hypothetical protein
MSQSHKAKRKRLELVIHSTASVMNSRSNDNRRQHTTLGLVGQDAGPVGGVSGEHWGEDFAANAARLGNDFTYRLGDDSLESQFEDQLDNGASFDDGIHVVVTAPRNLNSVHFCWCFFVSAVLGWEELT